MIKTSISHPLRIDTVTIPYASGLIGMTFCPGKKSRSIYSGIWDRDLDMDIKAIKIWGAQALVTLMEDHELQRVSVPELPGKTRAHDLEWYHLPIRDVNPPDNRFAESWKTVGPKLRKILSDGGKLVIHCHGGLGRTGTVAAKLLVEFGMQPKDAIAAVRKARPGAIETSEQENYVLQCREVNKRLDHSHFAGCLLGGAVGDALGAPIEFMSLKDIRKKYGHAGIKDFSTAYGRTGAITDDTQMTLFTAEGLLRAHCRGMLKGISPAYNSVTHHAYLRWLYTQGEISGKDICIEHNGWLLTIPELYARRAPGNSCLSALASGRMGTMKRPINDSKGCGGVMRVAPVGLYCAASEYINASDDRKVSVFDLGCQMAAITHGHPSGYLPAGCFALIIFSIVNGESLEDSIQGALHVMKKYRGHRETTRSITSALEMAYDKNLEHSPENIERIGGGWVGEEALAISLYCALVKSDDFPGAVRLAVHHSGDSDSTGAITGNILGALHGKNAITQNWLADLELRDVIEEISEDMLILFRSSDDWFNKYPGF